MGESFLEVIDKYFPSLLYNPVIYTAIDTTLFVAVIAYIVVRAVMQDRRG